MSETNVRILPTAALPPIATAEANPVDQWTTARPTWTPPRTDTLVGWGAQASTISTEPWNSNSGLLVTGPAVPQMAYLQGEWTDTATATGASKFQNAPSQTVAPSISSGSSVPWNSVINGPSNKPQVKAVSPKPWDSYKAKFSQAIMDQSKEGLSNTKPIDQLDNLKSYKVASTLGKAVAKTLVPELPKNQPYPGVTLLLNLPTKQGSPKMLKKTPLNPAKNWNKTYDPKPVQHLGVQPPRQLEQDQPSYKPARQPVSEGVQWVIKNLVQQEPQDSGLSTYVNDKQGQVKFEAGSWKSSASKPTLKKQLSADSWHQETTPASEYPWQSKADLNITDKSWKQDLVAQEPTNQLEQGSQWQDQSSSMWSHDEDLGQQESWNTGASGLYRMALLDQEWQDDQVEPKDSANSLTDELMVNF